MRSNPFGLTACANAFSTVISPFFTASIPLKATDGQMFEYACHEGNHGAAGMLSGARQTEKEAAAAAL